MLVNATHYQGIETESLTGLSLEEYRILQKQMQEREELAVAHSQHDIAELFNGEEAIHGITGEMDASLVENLTRASTETVGMSDIESIKRSLGHDLLKEKKEPVSKEQQNKENREM